MTCDHHYVILFSIDKDRDASAIDAGSVDRRLAFEQVARALGAWWQYTEGAMLLCTSLSIGLINEKLKASIQQAEDRFVVMEVAKGAQLQGWIAQDAWDWLKQHLVKRDRG